MDSVQLYNIQRKCKILLLKIIFKVLSRLAYLWIAILQPPVLWHILLASLANFQLCKKMHVSRSSLPAITFLFIGTVLIKVQAEIMLLLSFMPLRNQAVVRPILSLVSKNPPATFCHLSCAFLSFFLEPVDAGVSAVSRSNPIRLHWTNQTVSATFLAW